MTAIQYNDELWSIYFDSFLSYKYNLKVHTSEQQLKDLIIKAYFGDFGKMKNIDKVVWLHLYSRIQDLDLSKVIRLLGQIIAIHNLESDIYTHFHFRVHKPAFPLMPLDVMSTQHLSPLAIQVLFNYLVVASHDLQEKCGCSSEMIAWYNHYKDLMLILGSHINITLKNSQEVYASELNIMQTIFMILQFVPETCLVADLIFNALFSKHFSTKMEVCSVNMFLCACIYTDSSFIANYIL